MRSTSSGVVDALQDGALGAAARGEGGAGRGATDPTGLVAGVADVRAAVARDGPRVLFAGAVPRLLFNGVAVGATVPLRTTAFFWLRDGFILQLFDEGAGAIGLG